MRVGKGSNAVRRSVVLLLDDANSNFWMMQIVIFLHFAPSQPYHSACQPTWQHLSICKWRLIDPVFRQLKFYGWGKFTERFIIFYFDLFTCSARLIIFHFFSLGTINGLKAFAAKFKTLDFSDICFPLQLKKRGFYRKEESDGVKAYFYRDDGYRLWDAMKQ